MMVFVILHYMALDATTNVVNHILNDLDGKKRIIIVDNASPNGSGKKLQQHFLKFPDVEVILNKENIGFARGCNLGYKHAKKYSSQFVVLLNNDIEFLDKDFIEQVKESFYDRKFDVLGPDVLVPETGIHQNPKRSGLYTISQVNKINERNKQLLNQNKFMFYLRAYLKNISFIRRWKLKRDMDNKQHANLNTMTNVVLHGSILIFSKHFLDVMKEPFSDKTFFYFETEILAQIIAQQGLISKYDPSIKVLHHQNTATKESFNNIVSRQRFQLTNMIKSTDVYLELFTDEDKV